MLAVTNGASDNVLHELLICSMCLHECFVGAFVVKRMDYIQKGCDPKILE